MIAFPWDLMGTALVDNIPLSRIATITGVYGLSFEILLVNAAFVGVCGTTRAAPDWFWRDAFCWWVFCRQEASSRLRRNRRMALHVWCSRICLLNLNWTPEFYEKTLAELGTLSVPQPGELMPGDPLPDLVIWPESPAPVFENDARFRQTLSKIAGDAHAYVIAGEVGLPPSGDDRRIYNSAVVITPQGDALARYDKVHLVPFGEYVPFKDLLALRTSLRAR